MTRVTPRVAIKFTNLEALGLPAKRSKPIVDKVVGLLRLLKMHGLPEPETEYRFHPERKWRFDLCFPAHKLAVEVDGGVFIAGRHTRGVTYEKDCEKLCAAVVLGWRVLRVTPRHIKTGQAVEWIRLALA